jgi:riboflavin synthase
MFTGIIQDIGEVARVEGAGDVTLTVRTAALTPVVGASVAHNGICLTVIAIEGETYRVQYSAETASKTTCGMWRVGTRLNLEPALRVGDELGGHIVTGHVDGVAHLAARACENDSLRLTFEIPAALARFVAPKGSVALDGVSLTVNEVVGARFGVNIIPFTQTHTTLGALQVGDALNVEIDTLARYVARMVEVDRA